MPSDEILSVHVGTSPAGVSWDVYRKSGETHSELMARHAVMTENFDRHWAKYWSRVIRVSLTSTQIGHVEDVVVAGTEFAQGILIERFGIAAARADLQELAWRLDEETSLETCVEHVEHFNNKDLTDAQVQFGAQSRLASRCETIRKIEDAVK